MALLDEITVKMNRLRVRAEQAEAENDRLRDVIAKHDALRELGHCAGILDLGDKSTPGRNTVTRNGELAEIIRLACLIEHRTDSEQRALIGWAWDCDRAHNRDTTANKARHAPGFELWDLVTLVDSTRVLEAGDRPVPIPARWAETRKRWEG